MTQLPNEDILLQILKHVSNDISIVKEFSEYLDDESELLLAIIYDEIGKILDTKIQ